MNIQFLVTTNLEPPSSPHPANREMKPSPRQSFLPLLPPVPGASPQSLVVTDRGPNEVELRWKPPVKQLRNGKILQFEVRQFRREQRDTSETKLNTSLTTLMISNLETKTVYAFMVRAWTSAGAGPWTNPIYHQTSLDPCESLVVASLFGGFLSPMLAFHWELRLNFQTFCPIIFRPRVKKTLGSTELQVFFSILQRKFASFCESEEFSVFYLQLTHLLRLPVLSENNEKSDNFELDSCHKNYHFSKNQSIPSSFLHFSQ